MVLSSYDVKDFFPNNTSHNFFVKLNRALQFDGYWVVALTEIGTSERAQKTNCSCIRIYAKTVSLGHQSNLY